MADNLIFIPLQTSGLAGLTLRIVSAAGNTVPSPLVVTEVSGFPGLYSATFTGLGSEEAPVAYAGLLFYDGRITGLSTPTFLWNGTNFVYAPSGISGGLDAAGVRAAIGLASANLDSQLGAIDDFLDTEVAAIKAKTDNLPSDPADQSAIVDAIAAAISGLGGGGGLGPEDIARLERIEQQLTADIRKAATRYQRLLPGTSTVILDKDVSYNPATGFTLTEHGEPP